MRPLHMFFALLVPLLWGGNFVAAKYGVAYFPPIFFTAMRFCCVATILIPFVPRPTLAQFKRILPVALLFSVHFSMLFGSLYNGLEIATSAIVGQLGVPFSCLLGTLFLKDKIGVWRISGMVIAFVGIIIVAGNPNLLSHKLGFGLGVTATLFWATANIFVKRIGDVTPMQLLAWMSAGSVPILFVMSFFFEHHLWPSLVEAPITSWFGLTYTVLCSTIIAYGLWYVLLSKYTVSQITPYSLMVPVFGIGIGQLFFTEALTHHVIIGGLLTIIGVGVIVMRVPKLALLERTA